MSANIALLLHIAFAHLRVRARQTIVAMLGVSVGVGFFLAVSAMMIGSQTDFIRTLIDSAPHIIVRDEARAPPQQPANERFGDGAVQMHGLRARDEVRGLKDWPAMLEAARAIPGVSAAPALSGGVAVRFAGRTEALGLTGVDPRIANQIVDLDEDLVGGQLADLENVQNGLIISTQVGRRLGANIGDTVVISSSVGVVQRARIVAFIDSDARAGAEGAAYALLRTAQVLFARPNIVNQIQIRVPNPDLALTVAAQLEAQWGYKWESWQERSRDIMNALVIRNIIMYAVISAILLVASFGVYTVISTNVTEKRRDIAIMRAMGFADHDVTRVFLIEGVVVGALGAASGFVLGTILMQILASIPFRIMGDVFYIPLDRGIHQYAIAGGVSMFSAAIAAWLPARRAAKVDPVDILRGAA
ncbi:MAG: ABC transporter permease [Hyphomonadaceae bacterium]|nr:ABC transporter permease [Hyphomonadaceae bacterium]